MSYEEQLADSNPWVPDKPPPSNTPEDYLREEIKSAKNGVGGLLLAGFAAARTIQVFSRVPGTSGGVMVLLWPIGVGLQSFYLYGHHEKYGKIDATPWLLFVSVQLVWWSLGLFCGLSRMRQRQRYPDHEPGRGILCRVLPFATHDAGGAISDVVVGLMLIAVLRAIGSPVQASTYYMILGLTVFVHLCVFGQRWSYRLRLNAARKRAKNWHRDVRGRHYV